jgi:NAD(P)-dependent dehydrogenase (short-subunit alcohol dehydrogenase family)
MDLKERKIRVKAVSPGPINSPSYDRVAQSGPAGQQMLASCTNRVPCATSAQRMKSPGLRFFLASDDSSFVTGTELFVDGAAAQI